MHHYPETIQNLIRAFSKLPGVGEKTAERFTMHILGRPLPEAEQLARSILDVKQRVRLCRDCFSLSDDEQCRICGDAARDGSLLCVVEQPADMTAIEKSCFYKGLYHILGGSLSPIDGIKPEDLRIKELLERVGKGIVREVILATGTGVEGESTASYIARQLAGRPVRVSRIASGVPVGGDLKFINQMTLKCALEGRHDF